MFSQCVFQNCTDAEHPEVTLEYILSFITGAEYPPPLGFDESPGIRFSTSEFPLASTCALELILPTKYYDKPELFKERMVCGLQNHGDFGLL